MLGGLVFEDQVKLDLCAYLSSDNRPFSPSTYLRMKDTDRETLLNMINTEILERYPYKTPQKAQETPSSSPYAGQSLEECIKEAMTKMNVLRATALCKYIPCDEGYIHHFTFLKMRSSNPIQLRNLIKEHILDRAPKLVPPKKRHRRQSRELAETPGFSSPSQGYNLENLIMEALDKMDLSVENEEVLCRYFPKGDAFAHPHAYQSLKRNNPRKLACWIKNYILAPAYPRMINQEKIDPYRSGSAYQSSSKEKYENLEALGNPKIDRLLEMVGQLINALQGRNLNYAAPDLGLNENASRRFLSEKCYQTIQKELLIKILEGRVDGGLWMAFAELARKSDS